MAHFFRNGDFDSRCHTSVRPDRRDQTPPDVRCHATDRCVCLFFMGDLERPGLGSVMIQAQCSWVFTLPKRGSIRESLPPMLYAPATVGVT